MIAGLLIIVIVLLAIISAKLDAIFDVNRIIAETCIKILSTHK